MNWKLLILTICCAGLGWPAANAQTANANWYWVFFVPKTATPTAETVALSPNALAKRQQHAIGLDRSDLPVNPQYTQQLATMGCNCRPPLRWLNATLCQSTSPELLADLPFVREVRRPRLLAKVANNVAFAPPEDPLPIYDWPWWMQALNMPKPKYKADSWAPDVQVAVFDDGFRGMDTITFFDVMRDQIQLTRSFVPDTHTNVYTIGGHGTAVTSLMAGSDTHTQFSHLASQFFLARTENMFRESEQEEYNWAAAAEWADSIGVDIIQSSVGYNIFTSGNTGNHTYSELDGNTAIITKAADIAARKGIFVVNSAGNEGMSNWEHVLFPADGDSVMAVGATMADGGITGYSSIGPTADGRIKPDVVAPGEGVALVTGYGVRREGGGTSYASPLIAVLAAWLMEQQPDASNMEVFEAIRRSANRYDNPNNQYGHGMPDAQKALAILSYNAFQQTVDAPTPMLYPNPVSEYLMLFLPAAFAGKQLELELFDTKGAQVYRTTISPDSATGHFRFFVADLPLSDVQSILHARLIDTSTDTVILQQKLVVVLD